jgi:MFS family permease
MASFLTNFDVTAVVIALPALARELGLDVAGYAWVMDAYSLAFTASLLLAGALADRYGRRRAMLAGNGIFALASLACAMAWDGPTLWGARALQGIGAAFIITGGFALIASVYVQARARTDAFALLGVMSGLAMAFGPTAGGLVASWIGWRWIFLVNLPACALVAWGVPRLVAETREAVPRPLDILGVALFAAALTALVEGLLHGRTSTSHMVAGLALSAVFLAAFALQQRRRENRILDPGIFVQRAMIGIAILLCAVSMGYWAILVYLPLFFAAAFDWSPEVAGIALLTATLPMLFLPPFGGRLAGRLGWRLHFALALRDSGSRQCHHCRLTDLGCFSTAAHSDLLRACRSWGRRRLGSSATVRCGRVAGAGGSCRTGVCRDRRHAPRRLRGRHRRSRRRAYCPGIGDQLHLGVLGSGDGIGGGTGGGARLAARRLKEVAVLPAAPALRHLNVETASGRETAATAFFAQRLYIVAAISVWFET